MNRNDLTTTVDIKALLVALRKNRDAHGAAYQKAKTGYVRTTMAQLQDYITELAAGQALNRPFIPIPPEDHTRDYDDAIALLEWSQDVTIELTQAQFRQYVQDDWGWKEGWLVSNTAYLNQG